MTPEYEKKSYRIQVLRKGITLALITMSVMTYVIAIYIAGVSFENPIGLVVHLVTVLLISIISYSPVWFSNVPIQTVSIQSKYVLMSLSLMAIVLIGLVQSEMLFDFFRFSVPLYAIGIHYLLNLILQVGFIHFIATIKPLESGSRYENPRDIEKITLDEILGRSPNHIQNTRTGETYKNKVVWITGAAGSIGGEIARQLADKGPRKIILIDQSEVNLYKLSRQLKSKETEVHTILADIRDHTGMDHLMRKYKPHILFHAAAYKHVPFMEEYPYEAIRVNCCGTKLLVDLAVKYHVDKFILISTDKAVNPTTVMGASKRIAELYTNCQANEVTSFITTRFGNVFGSSGSVIPLFVTQIKAGGPVTVTDKEVKRYFMSIAEAGNLVLEAGNIGQGGEIFVFDMGDQINIYELATKMIGLSGLDFPKDIEINIIGLRPGEKLEEELFANDENLQPTYHEKIMVAKPVEFDIPAVIKQIDELCKLNASGKTEESMELMYTILKETGQK